VPGTAFDHLVVRKPGRPTAPLHVYVEGDGTPWRTREMPADDPTPRMPLAFELMLRDPQAALYLGRPCYFGVVGPRCDARVWTHERYSESVVESMAEALRAALEPSGSPRIVLIGHSGGGVLAVLLAHRLPRVAAVVTIGANLDVARWTARHGYSPLAGSLDPTRLPPATRVPPVPEFHYIGSDDRVVLPGELREYARGRAGVEVIEWPGFDHACCWGEAWRDILAALPPL
jgi:pimeloyl-ACP methyl ester carboxylesterase